ncbi:MAG: dynamin family protein [Gammaproteobacteria bacterium]|nr:dynamin family protein [Gammaproteobacteria bacterium]
MRARIVIVPACAQAVEFAGLRLRPPMTPVIELIEDVREHPAAPKLALERAYRHSRRPCPGQRADTAPGCLTVTAPPDQAHAGALRRALEEIERLAADIENTLRAVDTPLPRYAPDLTADQVQRLRDGLIELRARLGEALQRLGIEASPPQASARNAARVALGFVEIALREVEPGRLRSYGPLSDEAAAEIAGVQADLIHLLRRLREDIDRDDAVLSRRLRELRTDAELSALLPRLQRAIGHHGLTELRPALEALVERLSGEGFVVAVFGRVSVGKSSLLNACLGGDWLPVGAMPVTAVPLRVQWADVPAARLWREGGEEKVTLERLRGYLSERHNPDNRMHLRAAELRVPTPLLRDGLVLVDTPGLGSLARAGARAGRALLPRCDLGLVLVDAGSAPTAEDFELLRTLEDAGIDARLILSKADLLDDAERKHALAYLREQAAARLRQPVPVEAVSVRPGSAVPVQAWLREVLQPLAGQARARARASARRKAAALRANTVAALEALRGATAPERATPSQDAAIEAEWLFDRAHAGMRALCDALWRAADRPPAAPETLAAALRADLRERLATLPWRLQRLLGDDAEALPLRLLEQPALDPVPDNIGRFGRRRAQAQRLRAFADACRRWSDDALERLERAFHAENDRRRGVVRPLRDPAALEQDLRALTEPSAAGSAAAGS